MAASTVSTTILYLTDSRLDPAIANPCRKYLLAAAGRTPIVSVSQAPLDFGYNICVGDIGRSGLSLDLQLLAGLEHIKTRYVAIADSDCIYTREHFLFTPLEEAYFHYNTNHWLVIYAPGDTAEHGMYSYRRDRITHSQLVCSTALLRAACLDRMKFTATPEWTSTYPRGELTEPGREDKQRRSWAAKLCEPAHLQHLWPLVEHYLNTYRLRTWRTAIPNLDIKHGQNMYGDRKERKRRFSINPWGRFCDVIHS